MDLDRYYCCFKDGKFYLKDKVDGTMHEAALWQVEEYFDLQDNLC